MYKKCHNQGNESLLINITVINKWLTKVTDKYMFELIL